METFESILKICGYISVIGGALAIVWRTISPSIKLINRVTDLEKELAKEQDTLDRFDEANKIQNRILFAILNHMIDGNNVELMKKTRDEFQYIITK